MPMLTLTEVAGRLAMTNMYAVHQQTGISYNALKKIRDGGGAQYATVQKLSDYFQAEAE